MIIKAKIIKIGQAKNENGLVKNEKIDPRIPVNTKGEFIIVVAIALTLGHHSVFSFTNRQCFENFFSGDMQSVNQPYASLYSALSTDQLEMNSEMIESSRKSIKKLMTNLIIKFDVSI